MTSLETVRREKLEQEEKLQEKKKLIEKLKNTNQDMMEKFTSTTKKFYEHMGIDAKKNQNVDKDIVEKWRKITRNYFDSIRKSLQLRDPNVEKDNPQEKVNIRLPHCFILQDFFEERHKESAPKRSTFLFRDFECRKQHTPPNYYSYKVFLDWDIKFDCKLRYI